jgi:3-oxoacyl-[acyl-carrier protein] reductase
MRLKDRVAVVTGGGSGIGREICLAFAREGASVAVNDISNDAIEETIRLMGPYSEQAFAARCDVSNSSEVKEMFQKILERFGTVDILVNNAGIGEVKKMDKENPLSQLTEEQIKELYVQGKLNTEITQNMEDDEWDLMIKIHLYGTFYCTREALKVMGTKNYGRIINMASVAGTLGLEGSPHYCAAKAGIVGFTRSVAREVGSRGITVNTIAPGLIETPMTDTLLPIVKQAWIRATALKKAGKPSDISAAALYLASEEGNFLTGQIISPNGGAWVQ